MALIEEAASRGMEECCCVLLETGRLDINCVPTMNERLTVWCSGDAGIQPLTNHELGLYRCILNHGWHQDSDFCRAYVQRVDETIPWEAVEAVNMQFQFACAPDGGRIPFHLLEPYCPPLQSGLVVPDLIIDALLHEGGVNYVKKSYRVRGIRSKDVILPSRRGKPRKAPESQLKRQASEFGNVLLGTFIERRVQTEADTEQIRRRITAQLQSNLNRRKRLSMHTRTKARQVARRDKLAFLSDSAQ